MSAPVAVWDRVGWIAHNARPASTSPAPRAAVRDCIPGETHRAAVAAIASFPPTATPSLALMSDASAHDSRFVAAGLAGFSPAQSPAASVPPRRSIRTVLRYHCAFAPVIRILETLLPTPLACAAYLPPPPPGS